jgi:hypothetical protein
MNVDLAAQGASERVCVVIWDGAAPEALLRRYLDDTLPLRFERWQDHAYLSAIDQLRPRVIVVVEPSDELAADVAGLLACLITAYTPTIIGMTLAHPALELAQQREGGGHGPRLLVRQLGSGESAWIDSLSDLSFT